MKHSPRKLRIYFLVPFRRKTGGISVVIQYCSHLLQAGHDAKIFYPVFPMPPYAMRGEKITPLNILRYIKHAIISIIDSFFPSNWIPQTIPVIPVPFLSPWSIKPQPDIVIATAWPTAFAAMRFTRSRRINFNQGHEVWGGWLRAVERSYRLPLECVTISPWLSRIMRETYKKEPAIEIHNGVDLDTYHPPLPEKDYTPIHVFMIYSPLEIKGCAYAMPVLAGFLNDFPGARITIASVIDFSSPDPRIKKLVNPDQSTMIKTYQDATIFLFPTIEEGWGLPVLEAMASGCSIISTRTGCMEVLYNHTNAVIIRRRSHNSIRRALHLLASSEECRKRYGKEALLTARNHSWKKLTAQFEQFLLQSDSLKE